MNSTNLQPSEILILLAAYSSFYADSEISEVFSRRPNTGSLKANPNFIYR